MARTAADFVVAQEVKTPAGYPTDAAEQAARGVQWGLSIEPCHVTLLGGRSAGTAVAARGFIGMSRSEAVTTTQHLHAEGRFAMRRVAATGKGGLHLVSTYLTSNPEGVQARCNLDHLETMAFTISGLVGPWMIGGD